MTTDPRATAAGRPPDRPPGRPPDRPIDRPPGRPPDRPIDHPPVPRARLSALAIVLAVFGALVTGGYAWIAYTDYEPGAPEREEIPASVRSSPGGYRSFHFWHSGYHGGK